MDTPFTQTLLAYIPVFLVSDIAVNIDDDCDTYVRVDLGS